MSDMETVKASYPEAFVMQCWIGCWHIRRDQFDREGLSKKENCGTIDSPEKAWASAREFVEAQPIEGSPHGNQE